MKKLLSLIVLLSVAIPVALNAGTGKNKNNNKGTKKEITLNLNYINSLTQERKDKIKKYIIKKIATNKARILIKKTIIETIELQDNNQKSIQIIHDEITHFTPIIINSRYPEQPSDGTRIHRHAKDKHLIIEKNSINDLSRDLFGNNNEKQGKEQQDQKLENCNPKSIFDNKNNNYDNDDKDNDENSDFLV